MTYHIVTATQGRFTSGNGDTIYEAQGVAITGSIDMRFQSDGTTFDGGGDQTVYIYGGLFGTLNDYYGSTSGNDQITIGQTGFVAGQIQLGGGGHTITNFGAITADRFGQAVYVLGSVGAHQTDADTLVNAGTISASALAGVDYYDVITYSGVSSLKLVNSGSILAATGHTAISVSASGTGSTISNTGLISGDISFGGSLKLTNRGTIDGNIGLGGAATVVNRGAITGDVTFFGTQAHVFDGRRGTVDGTVTGGSGADTFYTGSDQETLAGGDGDDTYFVTDAGDIVTEAMSGGTDKIVTSVSYTLQAGSEIETLRAALGASGLVLTGNDLATSIFGGSGNDMLIGGAASDKLNGGIGADTVIGGAGNDAYYVDNVADKVIETAGGGTADVIYTSVNTTLASDEYVEYLRANTSNGLILTGNNLGTRLYGGAGNDTLTGGSGNDLLDGSSGVDSMIGGAGNDVYYVDNVGDSVTELANGGSDTVNSSITYTLTANVEALNLTGTGAINGTGNASGNTINGNTGSNVINGAGGVDVLKGGGGSDSFVFTAALSASTNVATITDFSPTDDNIQLSHAIFTGLGASGNPAPSAFTIGASASTASQRLIYNSSTGALFFDSDGNGAAMQVQFAQLTPSLDMHNTNFTIV